MIYTRSDVLPSLPDKEVAVLRDFDRRQLMYLANSYCTHLIVQVLDALYASQRFYYDCIYIHLKASDVAGSIKPQVRLVMGLFSHMHDDVTFEYR